MPFAKMNPYQSPDENYPHLIPVSGRPGYNSRPYSGIGIASFIISLASAISMFMLIVVAGILSMSTPGGMDKHSNAAILIGLSIFGFLFLAMLGFVLGVAGLFQQDRKKVFCVLGMLVSAATIGGTILLVMIGMAMKAQR